MTQRTRNAKRGIQNYPEHDFKKWERKFNGRLGADAAIGLKKWISSEEATRVSNIVRVKSQLTKQGLDSSGITKLPQPEDTRSDVIESLWLWSAPNIEERTHAATEIGQLLKQMEDLAHSAESLGKRLQARSKHLLTQDGFFEIPLTGLPQRCIQLASHLRDVCIFAGRKYIYPLDIADCCMALVLEMEDRRGLSQKQCHALIRCALLAHGCNESEIRPFDEELIERGTIRAKKEALRKKTIKSANFLYAVSHTAISKSETSLPKAGKM